MEERITQAEQNLLLLEKIIPQGERLYVWAYSLSGKRIASSCPEEDFFDRAFRYLGGFEKARAAAAAGKRRTQDERERHFLLFGHGQLPRYGKEHR